MGSGQQLDGNASEEGIRLTRQLNGVRSSMSKRTLEVAHSVRPEGCSLYSILVYGLGRSE